MLLIYKWTIAWESSSWGRYFLNVCSALYFLNSRVESITSTAKCHVSMQSLNPSRNLAWRRKKLINWLINSSCLHSLAFSVVTYNLSEPMCRDYLSKKGCRQASLTWILFCKRIVDSFTGKTGASWVMTTTRKKESFFLI